MHRRELHHSRCNGGRTEILLHERVFCLLRLADALPLSALP